MWRCAATSAGAEILASLGNRGRLTVGRIAFGSGTVANDAEVAGMTALKNEVEPLGTGSVTKDGVTYTSGAECRVNNGYFYADITVGGFGSAYALGEIGVWAEDAGGAQTLICVAYDDDPQTTGAGKAFVIRLDLWLSNGMEAWRYIEASSNGLDNGTIPPETAKIARNAFTGRYQSAAIPGGVTEIGESAFEGNYGPRLSLDARAADLTIGDRAFYGAVTGTLTLPDGVRSVGEMAFANCTGLTAVESHAKEYGERCFAGCTSLSDVKLYGSTLFSNNGDITLGPGMLEAIGSTPSIELHGYHIRYANQEESIFGTWQNGQDGPMASDMLIDASLSNADVNVFATGNIFYAGTLTFKGTAFRNSLKFSDYRIKFANLVVAGKLDIRLADTGWVHDKMTSIQLQQGGELDILANALKDTAPNLTSLAIGDGKLTLYADSLATGTNKVTLNLSGSGTFGSSLLIRAMGGLLKTTGGVTGGVLALRGATTIGMDIFRKSAGSPDISVGTIWIEDGASVNSNAFRGVVAGTISVGPNQDTANYPWGAKNASGGTPTMERRTA